MADAAAARRIRVLSGIISSKVATEAAAGKCVGRTIVLEPCPPGLEKAYYTLLSTEALNFMAALYEHFQQQIDELYRRRALNRLQYSDSSQLPQFTTRPEVSAEGWKVSPVTGRVADRRLDLGDVSPAHENHFAAALRADVQGIQVDFDDGHCPTWRNQLRGLYSVYCVVHGTQKGLPSISDCPILMLRPRAWNMMERNAMFRGKEVPGPVFDFALLMFHCARILAKKECGPFFYLSKVEGSTEARLWNNMFLWVQERLSITRGTVKACVLIENILSSFEMEEILYELREHSLGLNCGIWDYAASIIAKFGNRQEFVLPDRNKYVNMEKHFLVSYMRFMVNTCHKRGAYATGGMAAALLTGDSSDDTIAEKVCKSKLQEIHHGVDGFMVYDIRLVPHINKLWHFTISGTHQLSLTHPGLRVAAKDLLMMPSGGVTMEGLQHNIAVSILFIFHWFCGKGHFFYNGFVEDSATAEISRSQIWQWIRHQVTIENSNKVVDKLLVKNLMEEFLNKHEFCHSEIEVHKVKMAAFAFIDIVTRSAFPDFITTYLNETPVFWHFHNIV